MLWLLTSVTDNGLRFYNIFATVDLAKQHVSGCVLEDEWFADASGDCSAQVEGWWYYISQENFCGESHCGGCTGQSTHRKHCRHNPNYSYKLLLADRAEDIADQIGGNNPGASNHCYAAAGLLREQVRIERESKDTK